MSNLTLNPKQHQFCLEYSKSWNASRAYAKVYNVSHSTAKTNASRLLTNANINIYIQTVKKESEKKTKIDRQFIIDWFMKILEDSERSWEFAQEIWNLNALHSAFSHKLRAITLLWKMIWAFDKTYPSRLLTMNLRLLKDGDIENFFFKVMDEIDRRWLDIRDFDKELDDEI